MTDSRDIIHRVNDQDEIVFVNKEWGRFAAANVGEAVTSSQVLHHTLWEFISSSNGGGAWPIQAMKRSLGSRRVFLASGR